MSHLLHYYERELLFIRELAQEFARKYPGPARGLLLEANRSTDPHVERLIESFALLAGRIHHKLDDEFPELTEALLSVLYPHYLAPVPSMAVVQFQLDPGRGQLPHGFLIGRHSTLRTPAVDDLPCKFRTAYPVTLWPVAVSAAKLQRPPFPRHLLPPAGARAEAVLSLSLDCLSEMTFAGLALDRLRLCLDGGHQLVPSLYELIFNHCRRVVFRPVGGDGRAVELGPEECLFPVGFERDEGLLPYPDRSFVGYRLLTEFFTFPAKFHFLDLGGFAAVARAGFGPRLEVALYFDRAAPALESAVGADNFRPGCTPVVNLFAQTAEPIDLTHARSEYRVEPEVAHAGGLEVYSVDGVSAHRPAPAEPVTYQPFYSFRHGGDRDSRRAFWYASRRPSPRKDDDGTDVYLRLVDLDFDPALPPESKLVVRTTCTNRDLPRKLRQAGHDLPFALEGAAPVSRVRCVHTPTLPLRPPPRRGAHWRLLSHLNLNHLTLLDESEPAGAPPSADAAGRREALPREALQELLRLYDFSDAAAGAEGEWLATVTQNVVEGVKRVSSRRVVRRTGAGTASGFARGLEVTVELDEDRYVGVGAFLFAAVLERFLGLYVSINSFTQLVARAGRGGGPGAGAAQGEPGGRPIKTWPPRAGEQQLL